ncbi:uncharacterized protein LOC6562068 [Drosophila grimshawi]|uniref:GH10631 n=1 Tax=Drosophila grimshawi TaxID=7222 RepID=B4JCU5_DROGR|nr:uncharacterized protein LOC6562068 [Drosophila grimshawi]EDW03184.1 GH10631 [Drosophila grimshawi]
MDLQEFLSLERKQLEKDRQRLNAALENKSNAQGTCPAALLMQMEDFVPGQCQRTAANTSSECNEPAIASSPTLATASPNSELPLPLELSVELAAEQEERGADEIASTSLLKSAKEFVNQRELLIGSARQYKSPNASYRNLESERRPQSENRLPIEKHKKADDMEQWVTDTFYSYFPGFNNENQKRQNYLRERQRENQQNFLKHQMLHPPVAKQRRHLKPSPAAAAAPQPPAAEELQTARSSQSSTSTSNSRTDKTDLELIVNSNPNYVPPKIRPNTTRHQLLQDLGHVELSNIVTGDGIMERNMRSAELETARKKDYQRDLMQQIEEKRRSIELIRDKERRQDEALTRRLEAQLKTMHLEEQLEKERRRAEKARIQSEQNRLMREELLAKLEQDAQLLKAKEQHNNLAAAQSRTKSKDINGNPNSNNNNNSNINNNTTNTNKVYKYFSNSARHEYRRGQPLPSGVELDFELPQLGKIERECFHLSEKICPLCDEPLKNYESCCLRCQRKLALKMKQQSSEETADSTSGGAAAADSEMEPADAVDHNCQNSYALVCLKCERLYALCSQCLEKRDVCRACQRERNVCMSCRRNLCSSCLEEIACGRDTERTHINEQAERDQPQSDDAFRVLELNYAAETTAPNQADNSPPPYSFNIPPSSVFHTAFKATPVKPSLLVDQLPTVSGSANNSFELDSADEQAMERVRRQTDQRLSRYLKNYGDLASKQQQQLRSKSESRHRGTQTTPQSLSRRDVVLNETPTPNLSMPLLREMPKMTRKETAATPAETRHRKMDNLKKRWEVPAVQKFMVSTSSPKILTQVGAIRKQLQAARFYDDVQNEPDEENDDDDDDY